MSLTLDHIQLAMPEGGEETARAFWSGLIGLKEIEKPPALQSRGGLWLALTGMELHLGVEPGFKPAAKAHPGFCVHDIEDLSNRLQKADYPVHWDDQIIGRKRFFTTDPFGNRLEFLQTP
jgi:catechol 2,3-dioxygenase-like lactoylglutathione lyase family enzyme